MSPAGQFGAQALGVAVAAMWSAGCTYLIVKLLDNTVGARASLEEERNGLELAIRCRVMGGLFGSLALAHRPG